MKVLLSACVALGLLLVMVVDARKSDIGYTHARMLFMLVVASMGGGLFYYMTGD